MEHLYGFRVVEQGENQSRSIVENPSMIKLVPGMETNNKQQKKQGGEWIRGVGTGPQHPETMSIWSLVVFFVFCFFLMLGVSSYLKGFCKSQPKGVFEDSALNWKSLFLQL